MVKRKKNLSSDTTVDANAWLVTFADLVMLLLTFFVMLLTMSSIDIKKLKETFMHFSTPSGVLEFAGSSEITDFATLIKKYQTSAGLLVIDQELIKSLLMPSLKSDKNIKGTLKNFNELISIKDDARGITISFHGDILFDSGKTTIKKEVFQFLDSIAEAMESCPNEILIMGHTDNIPIKSRLYKSNQELSLYRGLSVLEYFLEEKGLSPSRFFVGGYGASMPLHPNDTPEKRAINRRVEIIFKYL